VTLNGQAPVHHTSPLIIYAPKPAAKHK